MADCAHIKEQFTHCKSPSGVNEQKIQGIGQKINQDCFSVCLPPCCQLWRDYISPGKKPNSIATDLLLQLHIF